MVFDGEGAVAFRVARADKYQSHTVDGLFPKPGRHLKAIAARQTEKRQ
jgi:hypothetical protein